MVGVGLTFCEPAPFSFRVSLDRTYLMSSHDFHFPCINYFAFSIESTFFFKQIFNFFKSLLIKNILVNLFAQKLLQPLVQISSES